MQQEIVTILNYLKNYIEAEELAEHPMNISSWEDRHGVLLATRQARTLIRYIEHTLGECGGGSDIMPAQP